MYTLTLNKELFEAYQNEEFAIEAFKEFRLLKGIECKKCGSKEHYWLKSKTQFQCKICKFRTTLRSGTVIEGSKLPVSYFFIALHLVLIKGNSLTTEELQEVTNHKYYEPLWSLLRKVKQFVKDNEQKITFMNYVEGVNEFFLEKSKVPIAV